MRWDHIAVRPAAPPAGEGPGSLRSGDLATPATGDLALFGRDAVARTFDTPGFRGITFYEVHAKTIINKVPEASRMPFRWTINPYRGCSHACAYCMGGETPILMEDGRTMPLAEVRVGDKIYGTVRRGAYRRYVITEVLAHWSTTKPGYLVGLADGTQLVASGDHRFLTNRGWKHVTGTEQGAARRPHLTTSNELLGIGKFADPPKESADYRRGYLCGMIRGDGHIGHYSYASGAVHRFRLALVDGQALARTSRYLSEFGISPKDFTFSEATESRRRIEAIRTSSADHVRGIERLIEWPQAPSSEWRKGFLAGVFDAEGSYSGGVLRISNTDLAIVGWIRSCLIALGFDVVLEPAVRTNG